MKSTVLPELSTAVRLPGMSGKFPAILFSCSEQLYNNDVTISVMFVRKFDKNVVKGYYKYKHKQLALFLL